MKKISILFFLCVLMLSVSCATSYDSAQWAKPAKHKKLSKTCKNKTYVKLKRNPNKNMVTNQ